MSKTVKISKTGHVTISATYKCTWETPTSEGTVLKITNKSLKNELDFAITGAPSDLTIKYNGKLITDLNGFFSLPANSPKANLQATGTFNGKNITIINTTNPKKDADAYILAS